MKNINKYILISILLLILDGLWITTNFNMYSQAILKVQKSSVKTNYIYMIIAYIFVLFTTIYIAIPFTTSHLSNNSTLKQKMITSLLYGGAVGLSAYGIYNFTSLSIYKDYPLYVGLLDTLWGIILNTIIVFVFTLL